MSSLSALPTELLRHIVEAAGVIEESYAGRFKYFPGRSLHWGTLFNIALTSKTLSAIAVPLLYQKLSTDNYHGYSDAPTSMIRTLCTRPDLAAHVTEIALGGENWGFNSGAYPGWEKREKRHEWQITPAEADIFNKAFRDNQISGTDDGEDADELALPPAPYQLQATKAPADGNCSDNWCTEARSALSGLALVSCPNVRQLMLNSWGWALPRRVRSSVKLEKLTHVHWSYTDTEGGFSLGSSLNWVFAAAPALSKLTFFNLLGIEHVQPCSSVTEVVLDSSCLDEDSMQALCRSFPKLERLTLIVQDTEYADLPANPSYVVSCLSRAYKTSLAYLKLDWSMAEVSTDEWEDRECSLSGLRSMTALRELVIESPFIHRGGEDEIPEQAFWASLLAPNLETVNFESLSSAAWNALPVVAAVKKTCGKMKKVTMRGSEAPGDEAEFKSIREAGGLGFDFEYTVFGYR